MKLMVMIFCTLFAVNCSSAESVDLSSAELKARIVQINDAQNKVMMLNSSVADVETLFSFYSDDFVYVHEVYGGTYTREGLYNNTVKYLKSGGYTRTDDRYKILSMITGLNAVAVERQETTGDAKHLAVFEFQGDRVSKIIEYWE